MADVIRMEKPPEDVMALLEDPGWEALVERTHQEIFKTNQMVDELERKPLEGAEAVKQATREAEAQQARAATAIDTITLADKVRRHLFLESLTEGRLPSGLHSFGSPLVTYWLTHNGKHEEFHPTMPEGYKLGETIPVWVMGTEEFHRLLRTFKEANDVIGRPRTLAAMITEARRAAGFHGLVEVTAAFNELIIDDQQCATVNARPIGKGWQPHKYAGANSLKAFVRTPRAKHVEAIVMMVQRKIAEG